MCCSVKEFLKLCLAERSGPQCQVTVLEPFNITIQYNSFFISTNCCLFLCILVAFLIHLVDYVNLMKQVTRWFLPLSYHV